MRSPLFALLIALIVVAIIALVPDSGKVATSLHRARVWFQEHALVITIPVVLSLCFARVRGTLRRIILHYDKRNSWFCAFVMVWLAIAALWAGRWFIPKRPFIFLYASGLLLIVIIVAELVIKTAPKKYKTTKGVLATDKPLTTRTSLAPEQIKVLESLEELLARQQQIRSIGLYGDWGTGKTSVYKTARRELKKADTNIIWVEIEPWRYTSQEALVLGFYEEIGKAMEKAIPGAQNSAAILLQTAEPLVRKNDKTGLLTMFFEWFKRIVQKQNGDPERYITSVLKQEGKYLVVVIDNVERNSSAEHVLRTLQLAHFLNAPNVAYIFIAEKDKLLSCMPERYKAEQAKYLEKFVEYELELVPPTQRQLRNFMNLKLKDSDVHIPLDFKIDTPDTLVQDMDTYRGVIKVFNQFIFELNRRYFRDGRYTVKLDDKYTLDHIRIKYPLLWKHIEQNRDEYDEGNRKRSRYYYITHDEAQVREHRRKVITQAIDAYVPEDKREFIKDILKDLFPQTNHLLGGGAVHAIDYMKARRERRVYHPDVLDEYFAGSTSLEAYDASLLKINNLLEALQESKNEKGRMELFNNYLVETANNESPGDAIRLLSDELLHLGDIKVMRLYFRSLLRAYCLYVNFVAKDSDDGRLAPVLSGINEFALQYGQGDEQSKHLDYIFRDVEKYMSHPSVMLRMLLYMHPARDNHFFAIQQWGEGYQALRRRGLKYVDDYYLKHRENNFFEPSRGYEWRFVFYQWALSVRTGDTPDNRDANAEARFKRVNNYIFSLWSNDHRLAYKSIREDFWGKQWSSETEDAWHVTLDKLEPYDKAQLITLAEALTNSDNLNKVQREDMATFLKLLKDIVGEQPNEGDAPPPLIAA